MSDDANFDDYVAKPVDSKKPEVVTTKKRKRNDSNNKENLDLLKQKARIHAKSPEVWRCVSKYGEKRLQEWVEEREHEQTQHLYETVFDFSHKMIAFVLDKGTRADGYVQEQIESDVTVRQCIEIEMANWVQFLSNRYKALACLSIDVANGKKKQYLEQPPEPFIEEEIVTDHGTEQQTE